MTVSNNAHPQQHPEAHIEKTANDLKGCASEEDIAQFLGDIGWYESRREVMRADWSARYYIRLLKTTVTSDRGEEAVLLVSPPDHSPFATPGHMLGDMVAINDHLQRLDLRVPRILAMDERLGLLLMEDFGRESLAALHRSKHMKAYSEAVGVLLRLQQDDALDIRRYTLKNYRDGHVYKALKFLPEYLWGCDEKETNEYLSLWDVVMDLAETGDAARGILPCDDSFTHIDFFAENLMWMERRKPALGEGVDPRLIGILDYQGAVKGPFVYDIVNLLEDARRNLPDTLKTKCKAKFCEGLKAQGQGQRAESFAHWYPVFAAQFHMRVLGQIFKLKTVNGRDDLMQHRTRLEAYIEDELTASPLLADIKAFYDHKKG